MTTRFRWTGGGTRPVDGDERNSHDPTVVEKSSSELVATMVEQPFPLESSMRPTIANWLVGQGLEVRHEVATAVGIADLVGCSFQPHHVQERLDLRQFGSLGSTLRVHLWHQIPDRDKSAGVLVGKLIARYQGIADATAIEQELLRLVRARFVRLSTDGRVQKLNGWHPLHDRLVAVEMKIARIEEAAAQAANYLVFADEAYVAAPLRTLSEWLSRHGESVLAELGIGALGVGTGSVDVLRQTRSSQKHPESEYLRTHVVEKFWRQR